MPVIAKRNCGLLIIIGLAMEAIFIVGMLVPFYLPAHYATPLLDLGKLTQFGREAGLAFVAIAVALFVLYYLAHRVTLRFGEANRQAALFAIVLLATLFSVTLVFVYPYGAADIFDYIFYGRMLAHFGVNPFVHIPVEFAGDPFLPYVAWSSLPFTYGPLWALLSGLASKIGGDNLLLNLVLYKGLAVGAYLVSLSLIYGILRRMAPRYSLAGLLFFAWNPLVVTETAANGHNDAVMMVFVLLAIRIAVSGKFRRQPLALTAIVLSALSKFITILLAPIFVLTMLRAQAPALQKFVLVAIGIIASVGLVAAFYAPFWQGGATLAVQRRDELFTASFAALLKMVLERHFGVPDAKVVGTVLTGLYGLYCLFELWRVRAGTEQMLQCAYRVILVYLLVACLWFQPWYLIWLLALAAVRPRLDIAHLSMLFSFTATMNYFVFDYLWTWNTEHLDFFAVQSIAVAVIYILPIGYGLSLLLRHRSLRPREAIVTRCY